MSPWFFAYAHAWNSCHTLFTRNSGIVPQTPKINCQKSRFLAWWPWLLTYDLAHQTCLRYIINKVHPHTKIHVRTSNDSAMSMMRAMKYRQTHTHRTNSITSTADVGGKSHRISWRIRNVTNALSHQELENTLLQCTSIIRWGQFILEPIILVKKYSSF